MTAQWLAIAGGWLTLLVLIGRLLVVVIRISGDVAIMRWKVDHLWTRVMAQEAKTGGTDAFPPPG